VIGGTGLFADGTAAAPSISFAADTDTGFYRVAANIIGVANNGSISMAFVAGGKIQGAGLDNELALAGNGSVSLRAGGTNQNITLTPSGTGVVSVGSIIAGTAFPNSQLDVNSTGVTLQATSIIDFKTGAGAQAARFQSNARFCLGTTTDSANGILQLASSTANTGGIGFGTDVSVYRQAAETLALDTATSPTMLLRRAGVSRLGFQSNATDNYIFTTTAASLVLQTNFTAALTLDASQNATFAGQVLAGAGFLLGWSGRGHFVAPSDGVFTLRNNAGTDFTRLQFGGTTSAFPAIKRSSDSLHMRNADDTAFCNVTMNALLLGTSGAYIAAGANTPEGATAAPVGSLYLRTNGGASTTLYVKESGSGNTGWVAK
jgi:hypothetical protein